MNVVLNATGTIFGVVLVVEENKFSLIFMLQLIAKVLPPVQTKIEFNQSIGLISQSVYRFSAPSFSGRYELHKALRDAPHACLAEPRRFPAFPRDLETRGTVYASSCAVKKGGLDELMPVEVDSVCGCVSSFSFLLLPCDLCEVERVPGLL
jgi:hypothetical protein